MFESAPRYGLKHNLMFQDAAEDLRILDENTQTYSGYLGHNLDIILGIRQCPVNSMTLCVTSDPEQEKCIKMRTALKAQLLKPEMVCHKGSQSDQLYAKPLQMGKTFVTEVVRIIHLVKAKTDSEEK
ncbi:melanotransferrin-like, partial [Homalodisca vitripennis]|uniref:melanotransferrin-like n=1 Tax=Homalodisca vitripennis TaxID=197043 RepID=UPI001EEA4098